MISEKTIDQFVKTLNEFYNDDPHFICHIFNTYIRMPKINKSKDLREKYKNMIWCVEEGKHSRAEASALGLFNELLRQADSDFVIAFGKEKEKDPNFKKIKVKKDE